MKKILFVGVLAVLLMVGCTKSELKDGYNKMQVGKEVDSYQLDLRIYGTYNNERVNEIVRIDNYKGTQFRVDYISKYSINVEEETTEEDRMKDNSLYLIDGVMYRQDSTDNNKYIKVTEEALYTDTNVYLEGLNSLKNNDYVKDETVVDKVYKVYNISVAANTMKDILKNSVIAGADLKNDVTGEVWVDSDGYVYKIIYNVHTGIENTTDTLIVNANYFRINNVSEIKNMIIINES